MKMKVFPSFFVGKNTEVNEILRKNYMKNNDRYCEEFVISFRFVKDGKYSRKMVANIIKTSEIILNRASYAIF